MTSAPTVVIAHHLPGRVRLRVAAEKRGDLVFFQRIAGLLVTVSGVEGVDVNPHTGSVLVRGWGFAPERLLEVVEAAGLLAPVVLPAATATVVAAATFAEHSGRALQAIGGAAARATRGYVDGRSLAQIAYLGISVWQIRRGQLFSAATSLLWHAGELGLLAAGTRVEEPSDNE